jgi:hypothetical protein
MMRRTARSASSAPRFLLTGDLTMRKTIIALIAATAFVAFIASLTGGPKPKSCSDFLQQNLFSCDMAKESQK